jgi:protein-disulfide isomerase
MGRKARRRREKKRPTKVAVERKVEVSHESELPPRRREKKRLARPNRRLRHQRIWASVAAAAVAATVLIFISLAPWEGNGETTPAEFIVPTPRPADIPSQGSTLGDPNAPLTIVEYSDFLCPYCKTAALEIVPQIEEEYVATGKVKLVFKHFVVHGEEAALAAGAAECAGEQDAFWLYHDMLFLNSGSVDFTIENLKQFGAKLALDTDSFNACLDSESYMDKLVADVDEARRRGVGSTPTFYVGQTQIVGAESYDVFKAAIEDELAKPGETSEEG